MNTPVNDDKTALLRVNAAISNQHSFQDFGFDNSIAVAPSFSWASYKLMNGPAKGLGIGFGGNYSGSSYGDATNTFTLPSYTMFDATLFYDLPKWRLGLKMNNITSEKAWDMNGATLAPRQWIANVSLKF